MKAILTAFLAGIVGLFALAANAACDPSPSPDYPALTRQCSQSAYSDLFGAYPGSASAFGRGYAVNVGAKNFIALEFTTGPADTAGAAFYPNNTFGPTGLSSISTVPGQFAHAVCRDLNATGFSAKAGTRATCRLKPSTTYYLNVAYVSYFDGSPLCDSASCATGWGLYKVKN